VNWSDTLSPAVQAAVPQVIEAIDRELNDRSASWQMKKS